MAQIWHDYRLMWNKDEYGGIEVMHIPADLIWLPDIILYNKYVQSVALSTSVLLLSANGYPHVTTRVKAAVYYTGSVVWEPPVIYNFMCSISIEWFPYDEQFCEMKFGSWTYQGTDLNMIQVRNDSKYTKKTLLAACLRRCQEVRSVYGRRR